MDVEVPQPELVDIDRLQLDGDNPNKMKKKQLHALRKAIQRWGFIVPIVTNRGLLVADGEQRITVAKELGMRQVPVVRLDVEDVDRRLLRQVLNKLKGQHIPELDQEEFLRIIEAGGEEDLKAFLVASDKEINAALSNEEETASRRSIVGGLRELAYALNLVADSQYSSRRIRSLVEDAVIPYMANQRRGEDVLRVDRRFRTHGPEGEAREYRKRPAVEASFAFMKTQFGLSVNRVRGLLNASVYALLSVLCCVLNREAAENMGRPEKAISPTFFNV